MASLPSEFIKNNGNIMVGAVVASFLGLGALWVLMNSLKSFSVFERGIASNVDLSSLRTTLALILENQASCASSGLVGIVLPANLQPDTIVSVPSINFPGDGATTYIQAGSALGNARRISEIRMVRISRIAAGSYFGELEVETGIVGKALSFRSNTVSIAVKLDVDEGTREISGCYRAESFATSTRVVTGTYNGQCSEYSYTTCTSLKTISVGGRPISVEIMSAPTNGTAMPYPFGGKKMDSMASWESIVSFNGYSYTQAWPSYATYFGGIAFTADGFRVKKALNINLAASTYTGIYHYIALVEIP